VSPRFLQGVQSNLSARSALTEKVRLELAFVLIHPEGAVRHIVVQGVRRPGKSLRVVILSKASKYYCCR
jgi:hypothetical protein